MHRYTLPTTSNKMDTSKAVEECENSISLLYLHGGFPQHAPLTSTTKDDEGEQEDADLSAFIPDPTVIMELSPELQNAINGSPKGGSGSGIAWGSDICVMMRCYRPGSGEDSQYRVVVSEEPVLVSELRFAERNVAYETLLAKAPASEIQKHYRLHLARLKSLRKAIRVVTNKLRFYHLHDSLFLKGAGVDAKSKGEVQRLKEGALAYKKAAKRWDKLRACERAVERLLVRCEDAGKGEPGFEKATWQTG